MKKQSNYYFRYRFNDKSLYKVETGKDGVTENDMRNLRRINKSQAKHGDKVNRLETISLEAIISGEDKHSILIDECVDVELLIETADEYDSLHRAIEKLLPQQRELVMAIYFNDVSIADYARKAGVTEGAIRDRLKKIYKNVEKNI